MDFIICFVSVVKFFIVKTKSMRSTNNCSLFTDYTSWIIVQWTLLIRLIFGLAQSELLLNESYK